MDTHTRIHGQTHVHTRTHEHQRKASTHKDIRKGINIRYTCTHTHKHQPSTYRTSEYVEVLVGILSKRTDIRRAACANTETCVNIQKANTHNQHTRTHTRTHSTHIIRTHMQTHATHTTASGSDASQLEFCAFVLKKR